MYDNGEIGKRIRDANHVPNIDKYSSMVLLRSDEGGYAQAPRMSDRDKVVSVYMKQVLVMGME